MWGQNPKQGIGRDGPNLQVAEEDARPAVAPVPSPLVQPGGDSNAEEEQHPDLGNHLWGRKGAGSLKHLFASQWFRWVGSEVDKHLW